MDIVFGVGDGHAVAELIAQGIDPVVLYIGDEPVVPGIGGYRVCNGQDVAATAGSLFGGHVAALDIVTARHWIDDAWAGDVDLRRRIIAEWWATLSAEPASWGNSLVDGLSGICNMMGNASRILPAPNLSDLPKLHCPVVAVGAGPSVKQHLDALRGLAGRAVIVACDAVLAGLHEAGIYPDLCTPLERLNSTTRKLPIASEAIFAGLPVVPPAACSVFGQHLAVSQPDQLYDWFYGSRMAPIGTGGSTGTMAVSVALAITDGPVYLVGHDLAAAGSHHWEGAPVSAETHQIGEAMTVAGARGGQVRTSANWARFALQIADIAHGRTVYHVAGSDSVRIPGTHVVDALPTLPDCCPAITVVADERNQQRYHEFRLALRQLPVDWDVCWRKARAATALTDFESSLLMPGRNHLMLSYLLRGLWAQCGVERRLGRPEKDLVAMCRQRIDNVIAEFRDALLLGAADAA